MFSRRYEQSQEFKERQGSFDFAAVACFVRDVAVSVRASLKTWAHSFFTTKKPKGKTPHQLALFETVKELFEQATTTRRSYVH